MTTTTHPTTVLSAAERWRLDPDFSTAEFRVATYWGLSTVYGRFTRLDGGIDSVAGRMWLVIDATSLDTGNARRDRHLGSADFFDCEHHPHIEFVSSTDIGDRDEQIRVVGDLTAAGRRVRLELEPTVEERGDRLIIEATTTIDQRELGMTYRRFGIRVPATVRLRALLAPEA